MKQERVKIRSLLELYEHIPAHERVITDVLRQIVLATLPSSCKEKISYNVPYFYGRKGICIIWPSGIPGGGVRQGVLLGFWYGNRLIDPGKYLDHGTNKQIFYKIFKSVEEIDVNAIEALLKEAIRIDEQWR